MKEQQAVEETILKIVLPHFGTPLPLAALSNVLGFVLAITSADQTHLKEGIKIANTAVDQAALHAHAIIAKNHD